MQSQRIARQRQHVTELSAAKYPNRHAPTSPTFRPHCSVKNVVIPNRAQFAPFGICFSLLNEPTRILFNHAFTTSCAHGPLFLSSRANSHTLSFRTAQFARFGICFSLLNESPRILFNHAFTTSCAQMRSAPSPDQESPKLSLSASPETSSA